MSEDLDWGDTEAAPRKKGVPKWLMFCGGGCLLLVVLGVLATIWAVDKVRDMMDPDIQWPKIEQQIAMDPGGRDQYQLLLGFDVIESVNQFQFIHQDTGLQCVLMRQEGADAAKSREGLFVADKVDLPDNLGPVDFKDVERGTIDIQGRPVTMVRFTMKVPVAGESASVFLDLTDEGDDLLMMQLTRQGRTDSITDDDVRAALAPFHIGPDRTPRDWSVSEDDEEPQEEVPEEPEAEGDGSDG